MSVKTFFWLKINLDSLGHLYLDLGIVYIVVMFFVYQDQVS